MCTTEILIILQASPFLSEMPWKEICPTFSKIRYRITAQPLSFYRVSFLLQSHPDIFFGGGTRKKNVISISRLSSLTYDREWMIKRVIQPFPNAMALYETYIILYVIFIFNENI